MRNVFASALIVLVASCLQCQAKDMIDVSGKRTGAPVHLHAAISSQFDNGFIRENSNFDNGQWEIGPEVPCGDSERYFEVWSRFSTISLPGIAFEKMKIVFTLSGASGGQPVVIERGIKGTLKHGSHFKGEDFGVRVHLACS